MTAKELMTKLIETPAGQRTSLENLLVAAVESGRIHLDGPATQELAQLRTTNAELLAALNAAATFRTSADFDRAQAIIAKHST